MEVVVNELQRRGMVTYHHVGKFADDVNLLDFQLVVGVKRVIVVLAEQTLVVHDLYEEEDGEGEVKYPLDMKAVRKGLRLMRDLYPRHWADLVEEEDDLITGDVWLQLAVFGELIYG